MKAALESLSSLASFSYRTRLETWVGVSGYTAYGEERGEGALDGDDFMVEMTRTSPEGEERYTVSFREGTFFLRRDGLEKPAEGSEVPGPLHRPRSFLELFSRYREIREEGEEECQGEKCRVFRLEYDPSLAADILPAQAEEYFSNLDFRLGGRIWLSGLSPYPVALSLELTGLDRVEKLQRLRLAYTFQPLPEGKP